ncbi:MAG: HNH endonuclease [Cyanobacteria bacterium SZAS LIN-2]|nr:HNH endonuclease [Cyanobacteria bacterium SZAS LIN-2]
MPASLKKQRSHAYRNQEARCIYCNAATWDKDPSEFMARYGLTFERAKRFQCTAEHLRARCDGGAHDRSNIAAACLVCNQRRHRFTPAPNPERYAKIVRAAVEQRQWHRLWVFDVGILRQTRPT